MDSSKSPMTEEWILDEGDIHDVLRNERRRLTLEQLRENGNSLSVRELSEQVAALETGESPPPRNIRQSVYVSLHQTHLPKLDELGIVDYDADAKQVTLTDRVREVERYMDLPAGTESGSGRRWAGYSLALSLVGLLAMIGLALDAPVLTPAGAAAIGAVCFASLLALAAYRLRADRDGPGRQPL